MYLPTELSPNWSVWNHTTLTDRVKPGAQVGDGATHLFDQVPDNELWLIERAVGIAQDGVPSDLRPVRFFVDANVPVNFLGVSAEVINPNYFVWEPVQPALLRGGQQLLGRWAAWTQPEGWGLNFSLTVQCTVLRRNT